MKVAIKQTKTSTVIGGLVLCTVLLLVCAFGPRWVAGVTHMDIKSQLMFFYSRLPFWFTIAILYWYAVRIEWQPLLLWPDHKYTFKYGFLSVLAILGIIYASMVVLGIIIKLLGLAEHSVVIMSILKFGIPLKLFIVLTAAVTEELIFRGYLMSRLQLFFKSPFWPIAISTTIFALGHFRYGTVINVVGPFIIGLVFALHYNQYRNIKILIICHFMIDFMALLVFGPRIS